MRGLLFYMWSVWFRLCRLYSSTPPPTNALSNINTLRLENIFQQPMGIQASSKKANSAFQKSAKENSIVLSTRCFSSRSEIPVWTRRLIPFAQNSLFKRTFHHLLYFQYLNTFLSFTLWIDNDVSLTSKRRQ